MFELYIHDSAYRQALYCAEQASAEGKEWMGLLVGGAFQWQQLQYAIAQECITAGNSASSVSVRFESGAFESLARKINQARGEGKLVVGWVHSHPNYGCFLSTTDVNTQRAYFSEKFNVALVIDPVRKTTEAFKLEDGPGNYRKASFAVIAQRR